MPKTKKEPEASQFRVLWRSAKASVAPAVLKECDFSKGLGPLLDKIAKKWDEAMDMNPVTDEAKASMAKTCGEIQEVMKKYRKQIVDANKKLPRHGMQWYALEKALKRLDDGLRDDMGEVEVEYTRLPGWNLDRDVYDREAGLPPAQHRPPDAESKQYNFEKYSQLAEKMSEKAGDPGAVVKAMGKLASSFFPLSREKAVKLDEVSRRLAEPVEGCAKMLKDGKRDGVLKALEDLEKYTSDFFQALPNEAVMVEIALDTHVFSPLKAKAR